MRIGFVGLGDQGGPMARAIAEAGWPLTVWARRPASLDSLAGTDHDVAGSVAELGARCDVVGLCVRDDRDVTEIAVEQGLLAAMRPGAILVNHSTGSPDACASLVASGVAFGVHVLDAPVSGGGQGARSRTLTVMVGGDAGAAERCRPVFESFARLIWYLGPCGSGQLAKLVNNLLLAANMRSAAAVIELGAELGFEMLGLTQLLGASSGQSFALDVVTRERSDESAAHLQAMVTKDVRHLWAAARSRGIAVTDVEQWAAGGLEGVADAIRRIAATRSR